MTWLNDVIQQRFLSEEVEEYLLGRGLKESFIKSEKMFSWILPKEPVPDPVFVKRYGEYGEALKGMSLCPIWSPKGVAIGFEARSIKQKYISDYRLPEAYWNPFWIGTCGAMDKIWSGGDVWIGEGLFDIAPLEWVVPDSDAVLASVRAKLSFRHVNFLKRFCQGWVHMVYDRDEAGRNGVLGYTDQTGKHHWGALDVLRYNGLKCRDVMYRGGKDPGEIWDRGGLKAVKEAFPTTKR